METASGIAGGCPPGGVPKASTRKDKLTGSPIMPKAGAVSTTSRRSHSVFRSGEQQVDGCREIRKEVNIVDTAI